MNSDFEAIVRENSGRILRIAKRYSGPGETEDLIQEILIELWKSKDSFRGESRIETWIYRIALNTAMGSVRKKTAARKHIENYAGLYREESVQVEKSEADILNEFMDALNEVDASVLMMTLDGLSAKEIKDVIGTSEPAIAMRISRIKQKYVEMFME